MTALTLNLPPGQYGTVELGDITGVTYRRLSHWADRKVLVPSIRRAKGSGSRAIYSTEDAYVVLALKAITEVASGLTIEQMRSLSERIRPWAEEQPERLMVEFQQRWSVSMGYPTTVTVPDIDAKISSFSLPCLMVRVDTQCLKKVAK